LHEEEKASAGIDIVCDVWTIYGIEPYLISAERCAPEDVAVCLEFYRIPKLGVTGIGKRN
jgi:hypothetical protein